MESSAALFVRTLLHPHLATGVAQSGYLLDTSSTRSNSF